MRDEYIRDEFSIGVRGLVIWLLTWTSTRHTDRDRTTAKAMLQALFSWCLDNRDCFKPNFVQSIGDVFAECLDYTTCGEPCRYIRHDIMGALEGMLQTSVDTIWSRASGNLALMMIVLQRLRRARSRSM